MSYFGPSFIGKPALLSQINVCYCDKLNQGAKCEIDNSVEIPYTCGDFGTVNKANPVSGCECKIDGFATPYHGWYCNVPNTVICPDNKFYIHNETEKVADEDLCFTCTKATELSLRCGKCEQFIEFGEVTCTECNKDLDYYNLTRSCMDKCDMANPESSGCKDTEECKRIDDGDAKCSCLIPVGERISDSKCECAVGSFIDGHCVYICETSDDCNVGKCVTLPDNHYKSCLCPIEK